jgi:hypothetical protein
LEAPAAASTSRTAAIDDPEDAAANEPVAAAWGLALRRLPAWLVSLVVHLGLLLTLALCRFAENKDARGVFVIAETAEAPQELVENLVEVELAEKPPEFTAAARDLLIADVGLVTLGDVTLSAEVGTGGGPAGIALSDTTFGEIGALFGKDGAGMANVSDGLRVSASFFGARARGEKFVFVVDNSNSMVRGRFETALLELMRTVDSMTPQQQFYVVFFSDSTYRLFHPNPAAGVVPATELMSHPGLTRNRWIARQFSRASRCTAS